MRDGDRSQLPGLYLWRIVLRQSQDEWGRGKPAPTQVYAQMRTEQNDLLIRTEALTRSYRVGSSRVVALDGVDLAVRTGSMVALRGRSGSGKTTLLNCIGGLDQPSSGQVWFQGREMGALSEGERVRMRRRRIGFVFQSFALLPTYSAAENISLSPDPKIIAS